MSVNKAILVGNLGRDPEIRHVPSGQTVANFSIATTEWHRIVAWGKLAEVCAQYLKKGRQVYVEGRITNRQYDAKDGSGKRSTTEIVAQTIQFLGGRAGAMDDGGGMGMGADMGPPPMDDEDIPF